MSEIYEDDSERDDNEVTTQDCLDYAAYFLKIFFKNKVDQFGFEIDQEDLLTDRNISLVANMTIFNDMSIIYDALRMGNKAEKRKGKIAEDVELVLKLLNECAKISAPKNFAIGLIAIYVEICEGCKLEI